MDKGIRCLLRGEGKEFLDWYYEYIEKIYNYRIPLKEIASKGKIKKSIEQYKKDIQEVTKAGTTKAHQAWYELAIKHNLKVDNGDTIYYINTGKAKSHADIKKVTKYIHKVSDMFGDKEEECTKMIDKGWKEYRKEHPDEKNKNEYVKNEFPDVRIEEELVFNCVLIPQEDIEKEEVIYCNEDQIYNVDKYIDMFNKRIKPLLVCFDKSIRKDILIRNPNDRKFFSEEQTQLVSGQPNNPTDQDTYEQLMTMEDKEIKFWIKYGMTPPFFEECGMGKWNDCVSDYERRKEEELRIGLDKEKETFARIISEMTNEEIDAFYDDGEIPQAINRIADLNPTTLLFMSKQHPEYSIGSIVDFTELIPQETEDDE